MEGPHPHIEEKMFTILMPIFVEYLLGAKCSRPFRTKRNVQDRERVYNYESALNCKIRRRLAYIKTA